MRPRRGNWWKRVKWCLSMRGTWVDAWYSKFSIDLRLHYPQTRRLAFRSILPFICDWPNQTTHIRFTCREQHTRWRWDNSRNINRRNIYLKVVCSEQLLLTSPNLVVPFQKIHSMSYTKVFFSWLRCAGLWIANNQSKLDHHTPNTHTHTHTIKQIEKSQPVKKQKISKFTYSLFLSLFRPVASQFWTRQTQCRVIHLNLTS